MGGHPAVAASADRLQGRGGRPEDYCHRQLLDTIRDLVTGGIFWRAMPADFPAQGRVYAFFQPFPPGRHHRPRHQ
ncbi:transposase [Streptomyces ardesiacus]